MVNSVKKATKREIDTAFAEANNRVFVKQNIELKKLEDKMNKSGKQEDIDAYLNKVNMLEIEGQLKVDSIMRENYGTQYDDIVKRRNKQATIAATAILRAYGYSLYSMFSY